MENKKSIKKRILTHFLTITIAIWIIPFTIILLVYATYSKTYKALSNPWFED